MTYFDLVILSLEIGLLALIVIGGIALLDKHNEKRSESTDKLVRRCIELGFWAQKRERKLLKK